MQGSNCAVLLEATRLILQSQRLRNLLQRCAPGLAPHVSDCEVADRIISEFFLKDEPPIDIFYQFLWLNRAQINDWHTLKESAIFRDLCLIKSMPQDLHTRYVDAFRKRNGTIISQTEDKELISLQLAAAALEVIPFSDSSPYARLGPTAGGAYALELNNSNWTLEFGERTCDHVFPWGEPPMKGAIDKDQQLRDFIDALIKRGIKASSQLKDDLNEKTMFVGKWLAREKKINKYYVAIIPKANSSLIEALETNEHLNHLIVVGCPDGTSYDLALVKQSIDDVRKLLINLSYQMNH
jgi:hypothetical protein